MLTRLADHILDRVLDRLIPVIEAKIDALADKAMAMIAAELPGLASKVAESAVKTVFEHTQVDEAVDDVAGAVRDIFDRLPRFGF